MSPFRLYEYLNFVRSEVGQLVRYWSNIVLIC